MNVPRKVVVSRAERDNVIRESVRDESQVRVSMNGTRTVGPSPVRERPREGALRAPKKVAVSRSERDRVLRESVRDESQVRVSMNGTRKIGPSSALRPPNP